MFLKQSSFEMSLHRGRNKMFSKEAVSKRETWGDLAGRKESRRDLGLSDPRSWSTEDMFVPKL